MAPQFQDDCPDLDKPLRGPKISAFASLLDAWQT
jgi:hypothetical protein